MEPDDAALAAYDRDLMAPTDPATAKTRAAWRGAAAAALPAGALLVVTPWVVDALFPTMLAALNTVLPFGASIFVAMALASLGPALMALPVAATAAATAHHLGKRDRDLGLAAAAGASMGTAAITAGFLTWALATTVGLSLMAPLAAASALGVGVVGAAAFLAVPRDRKHPRPLPGLYQGLLAAGAGVPAMVVGGGLWNLLTTALPFLSAAAFREALPLVASALVYPVVFLTALTPVTYLGARAWRRRIPDADPRALGLGLLYPPLLPFLILTASMMARGEAAPAMLALALGNLLGVAPHALAALAGLRAGAPPARLPGGTGGRELPSGASP